MFPAVGSMPMPAGFRYCDVYRHGRPSHGTAGRAQTYDAFYRKHPPMDVRRRAKIFAPFDALRGFQDAVAAKRVLYEERRDLTEGEREDLDRKLEVLHRLTKNGRMARENRVFVTVTRFIPCQDPENEAYGKKGRYEPVDGIVQKIDALNGTIVLDSGTVRAEDILDIELDVEYELSGKSYKQESSGLLYRQESAGSLCRHGPSGPLYRHELAGTSC